MLFNPGSSLKSLVPSWTFLGGNWQLPTSPWEDGVTVVFLTRQRFDFHTLSTYPYRIFGIPSPFSIPLSGYMELWNRAFEAKHFNNSEIRHSLLSSNLFTRIILHFFVVLQVFYIYLFWLFELNPNLAAPSSCCFGYGFL